MSAPREAVERAWAEVDRRRDVLLEVSHRIFEHPELCFEERHAHDLLCDVLEREGLAPRRRAFGLDTAFAAEAGEGGPTVAVICEYDALRSALECLPLPPTCGGEQQ